MNALQKSEQLKNIASALQSAIVSVAALVGGGWALYTFTATKQSEQAYYDNLNKRGESELKKLDFELKNLAISVERQKAELNPQMATTIETKTVPAVTAGKYGLLIKVTVENKGDLFTVLELEEPPPRQQSYMRLSHIGSDEKGLFGTRQYFPKAYNNYNDGTPRNGAMQRFVLWPKSVHQIEYYVELDDPGLYNVSFYSHAQGKLFEKTVLKEVEDIGKVPESDTPGRQWYGTHTYVYIASDRSLPASNASSPVPSSLAPGTTAPLAERKEP
jgi:hypothetical protein